LGQAWAAIKPHLPKDQPGTWQVDDRRVKAGSFHAANVHAATPHTLPVTNFDRKAHLMTDKR